MPGTSFRPWQSVRLPQVITIVALVVGLPLYLRSPLWCDLTLYDLAARNLLQGGVHYRDLFDTNLPGFVWILTAIRGLLGFSPFALRCVDLAIVAVIVLLIDRIAKRGGATPASRWWAVAAVAVLYPSTVEMVHAQRDIWMALPAVAAVLLRLRRTAPPSKRAFAGAMLEGALWGVAIWIKPHCVLMAVGVWLVTVWRVAGAMSNRRTGVAIDALGNLAGGIAAGIVGLGILIATGGYAEFWEVLTVWAPEYASLAQSELHTRYETELHWFPPWSLWLVLTVPLALLSILDASPWIARPVRTAPPQSGPVGSILPRGLWDREAGPDARFARAALAALYLVWAVQSFYIQRLFIYSHMAELFLMFGLWASHRWAMPAIVILWLAVTSSAWLVGDVVPTVREHLFEIARHDGAPASDPDCEHYIVRHPLADGRRLRLWPQCWRPDLTDHERYSLWDRLRRIEGHEASVCWVELEQVAEFLRSKDVKNGELLAWHDSPHVLYLMLDIKPGVRYMHVNTAQIISPEARKRVQEELAATAKVARFAVSDLMYPTHGEPAELRLSILGPPANDRDLLPVALPPGYRREFPFNQRAVFRTNGGLGRYVVHELTPPFGDTAPKK